MSKAKKAKAAEEKEIQVAADEVVETISEKETVEKIVKTTPYKVKSGDTLELVAQKKLGDCNRYKEIMFATGITTKKLCAGQVLQIPIS